MPSLASTYKLLFLSSLALVLQSCAPGHTAFNTDDTTPAASVSTLGDPAGSGTSSNTASTSTSSASNTISPDPAHPGNTTPPVGTKDIYGGIVPFGDTVPLGQAPASSNVRTADTPYNPQPFNPYASTPPFYVPGQLSTPATLADGNITSLYLSAPNAPVDPLKFAPQTDPQGTPGLYCDASITDPSGDIDPNHWSCIKNEGAGPAFGVQPVPSYDFQAQGDLSSLPQSDTLPNSSNGVSINSLFSRPRPNPLPTFVTSGVPSGYWVNIIRNQDAVQLMNYVSDSVKVMMVGQNPDYASDVPLQDNPRFKIAYWEPAAKGSSPDTVEVPSQLTGDPSHHADWVLHKMMYQGGEDPNNGFLAKKGKVLWVAKQENYYNHEVPFAEIISSSFLRQLVENNSYHILSTSNGIFPALDDFWRFYNDTHGISGRKNTSESSDGDSSVAKTLMKPIQKIWGQDGDWNESNPYPTAHAIYLGHLVVPSDVIQEKNSNIYSQVPMINALNYLAKNDDLSYIEPTGDDQNGQINLLEALLYAYPNQWEYLRQSMIVVGAINIESTGRPHGFANTCALSSRFCVLAYPWVYFKNKTVTINGKVYFEGVDTTSIRKHPGVSFSAPYVVSEVALVRSVFPFFTNYNVQTTVLTTSQQLHYYTPAGYTGSGEVNAGYPFSLNTGWGAVRPDVAVSGPKMFYFRDFVVDFNHRGTDLETLPEGEVYTFANNISGPHGLQVTGNDQKNVLNLAGDDTYQGATLLASKAIVNVDGRLQNSDVTVEPTANLYGQGEVKSVSNAGSVHAYRYPITADKTNEYALQQASLQFAVKFANGDSETMRDAAFADCGIRGTMTVDSNYSDDNEPSVVGGSVCGGVVSSAGYLQTFWKVPSYLHQDSRGTYTTVGFDYEGGNATQKVDGTSQWALTPGLLVDGNYQQTEAATLFVHLDQPLTVAGQATLAGTLDIDGASALLMPSGQEITALVLVSKHQIQGAFSTVKSGNSSRIEVLDNKAYSVVLTDGGTQYYGVAVRAKYMDAQSVAARSMGSREVLMGAQNVDQIHDQLRHQWLNAPTAVARQALMQSPLYRFAVQLQSASDDQLLKAEKALQGESYTRYLDQTEGASLQDNMLAQWSLLQHRPSPFTVESHLSATWGKGAHDYRQSLNATYAQPLWRAQLGLVHDNAQLTDQPHSTKNQRWALDLGVYYQLPMFGVSVQVQAHHIKQHWTLLSLNTAQTADYAFKQNAWMESIAVDKAYRLDGGLRLDPYVGLQWVQNHLNAGDVQGKEGQLYFVLPEQNEHSTYATLGLAMNQDQVGGLPLSLGFKYAVSIPVFYNPSYAAQLQDNAGHQSQVFFETQHQTEQLLSGAMAYHVGSMSLGVETQLIYQYHWMAGLSLNASVQF